METVLERSKYLILLCAGKAVCVCVVCVYIYVCVSVCVYMCMGGGVIVAENCAYALLVALQQKV